MYRVVCLTALLAACVAVGPARDGAPTHHALGGFRNDPPTRGLDAFGFVFDRTRIVIDAIDGPPRSPPLTREESRAGWAALNGRDAVQWIGHATVLARLAGVTVIVDPVFAARVTPLPPLGPRRNRAADFQRDDLPAIDAIVITHDHHDHFEPESIRAIAARGPVICLAPLRVDIDGLGCAGTSNLDWGQSARLGGVELTFLPAQHESGRGVFDRDRSLWGSWLIASNQRRIYVAGDTGYGPHLRAIGERHGPIDLALINLGGFLPRGLNHVLHLALDEALRARDDLRARRIIPVHWGTYVLGREDADATGPALRAHAARRGHPDAVIVLRLGESLGL